MKKITSIIGARPQFIKHAPLDKALKKHFTSVTIHTGQHYDEEMSNVFFNELGMSLPDHQLSLDGASKQGEQTGIMMTRIEQILESEPCDAVLVYGDTNSTLAGAVVASKLNIPIIHIEAGLRSFNRSMPEEINRIITDHVSAMLFCSSDNGVNNLRQEGVVKNVFRVGDVMCDTLEMIRPFLKKLYDQPYYFATIHRPYNTDNKERLSSVLSALNALEKKVILPLHPRTVKKMAEFGLDIEDFKNIMLIRPVSYVSSVCYQAFSDCIITDSGGMQKEAYMMNKRCITLRSETEWTETLEGGWNTLIFDNLDDIQAAINRPAGKYTPGLYGDGHAADEIVKAIYQHLNQ